MADPTITDTLRALHARGIIASYVLPGMRLRSGSYRLRYIPEYGLDGDPWQVDIDDPVTVAALIVLVREAWDTPALVPTRERDAGWIIADGLCSSTLVGGRYLRGPTEIDAMHAALRARLEVTP